MASLNGCLSFKLLPSLAHTTNKTAIIGMTRQLALEGSEHGIRVNSISPGFIETNSTRGELEDEEFGRQMRDRTLLGRFGQAEDIANAALCLASDQSSYITGIDLVVDGGIKQSCATAWRCRGNENWVPRPSGPSFRVKVW
jgi:NAD(P)-dependent dehydrogenase (short-subunit alcohol dehydrogenase family)